MMHHAIYQHDHYLDAWWSDFEKINGCNLMLTMYMMLQHIAASLNLSFKIAWKSIFILMKMTF